MTDVFSSYRLGRLELSNRLVMAPMTRSRAQSDGTPGASAALYYGQRASIGLIISEGTQPSDDGQGYLTTPGIYTPAHVAGWRKVADAVHARGSHLFIQLMHVGRMSHPDNTPHHRQALAPSSIAPGTPMFTAKGMLDIPVPRAMTQTDIDQIIAEFRHAARSAIEAGADGVEIHGANAYLIHQFLAPSANARTDRYGGSIESRARFAIEVAAAVADEIGADRTGIRLSPGMAMWGIDEGPDSADLYRHLVAELDNLGLAYLHITHDVPDDLLRELRTAWHQTFILNRPGRARDTIGSDVASGLADLESYGVMVLANPDLVERIKADAPLNEGDRASFFGGSDAGYVDYPSLENAAKDQRR
ncbi:alkene reductase [Sphingopyxis sp. MG]|uniref:alkene reductase n=1 Tax=Sphingopyxis sp. MG TaxID=1866325 RepID=UPI000CDF4672|nr:alkene reductase [Sphingopyxis sp. MG]AVA15114.1 alkene reductase [Sphingopyxis sp. MG]